MIATSPDRAEFAYRLASRGYPVPLALRVAMTPPLAATTPSDDDSRPGRDLAESLVRFQALQTIELVERLAQQGGAR